ncbi:MAG TPA: AAA family ATPase [Solirubrobacteraceae bacterium]|nr:AAA family ATPase [Solirubrobacteraceae bacterium]
MELNPQVLTFENPFRPGAGHMPPYLAGRQAERAEFERLLRQTPILENLVLTGLRGAGKTVLLDTLKPLAIREGWLWVGTDLSEAASVSEHALAIRLLTDLSVVTSSLLLGRQQAIGFTGTAKEVTLSFDTLMQIYDGTPGLVADKIKAVLELVAQAVEIAGKRGVIFAYDEAQNLADTPPRNEFPLSLLLDVFQSIQKKNIQFMLVLTGLPTLFPKLVEARTFAERMFRVLVLGKLNQADSREAIVKPIQAAGCPVRFDDQSVETVCQESGGYPYFIQFICREVYDVFIQQIQRHGAATGVPVDAITRKLDSDFFAGGWARATDRQRELLWAIASLRNSGDEFAVQEIVVKSEELLQKPFSNSHVNQMLATLTNAGLIYKNRWGKYSFAVPLFDRFIIRQAQAIALGH